MDELLAVDLDTVQRAREIVLGHAELTARDAVHVAAMERHGVREILSFDRHFDGLAGIVSGCTETYPSTEVVAKQRREDEMCAEGGASSQL